MEATVTIPLKEYEELKKNYERMLEGPFMVIETPQTEFAQARVRIYNLTQPMIEHLMPKK